MPVCCITYAGSCNNSFIYLYCVVIPIIVMLVVHCVLFLFNLPHSMHFDSTLGKCMHVLLLADRLWRGDKMQKKLFYFPVITSVIYKTSVWQRPCHK